MFGEHQAIVLHRRVSISWHTIVNGSDEFVGFRRDNRERFNAFSTWIPPYVPQASQAEWLSAL
jgi:hypothetical protein